jgi:hypothetical protein
MLESAIIASVAGAFYLLFKFYDSDKDMERYFHKHEPHNYYLLQFAVIVLAFSFFFHGRHIAGLILKKIWSMIVAKV